MLFVNLIISFFLLLSIIFSSLVFAEINSECKVAVVDEVQLLKVVAESFGIDSANMKKLCDKEALKEDQTRYSYEFLEEVFSLSSKLERFLIKEAGDYALNIKKCLLLIPKSQTWSYRKNIDITTEVVDYIKKNKQKEIELIIKNCSVLHRR
ncbi:hypothetical protein QI155_10890 [Thermodesulfovibrio sp. 1176]|uniref:hypothetical protein n=1 Tax=Thermodesulfovibrio sp. 1176 TaxID=3043424 RepID=UPI00248309E4|nr:hypothetical protein [Thermodesulfovibrio sp. 1176]MDI1473038.1 hypothetical protein [Thermodesulfovibrio sp. 1176]